MPDQEIIVERFRKNLKKTNYNDFFELIAYYDGGQATAFVKPTMWQKIRRASLAQLHFQHRVGVIAILKLGMPENWRISEKEISDYCQVVQAEYDHRYQTKTTISQTTVKQLLGCLAEIMQ